MKRYVAAIMTVCCTALVPGPACAEAQDQDRNWPSFRGARACGIAEGFPTPVRWSVDDGDNIRWKTPIPGLAHSSPVIWGNRLFVTTAVREAGNAELKVGRYGSVASVGDEGAHRFQVYCLDKDTGKILWSKTAHEGVPRTRRHPKGSHASSSPATDGKHVVACFGSEGLYCYDLEGKLVWKKDLGVLESSFFKAPEAEWGFASSPVIHQGRVVLQVDVLKGSFLAAFDVETGKERWRTPRDDVPTWSTPTVYEHEGRLRIAVNGFRHLGGYDFETGKALWKLSGGGDIPVPTPVAGHGLLFFTSAHGRQRPIYAVSMDAEGAVTDDPEDEAMRWSNPKRGIYLQTPLVYGEYLYCCSGGGVLACYEARTGEEKYRQRLGGRRAGFSASPVAAVGKIYVTGEEGEVHVVTAGPAFEVTAVNALGETCMATPAISEGTLFFRTRGHVIAVAEEAKKK